MAAGASSQATLAPPPGAAGQDSAPTNPPSGASSPAQPAPGMNQGTNLVLDVTRSLRAIAAAYPGAAPIVAEMNDKVRDLMRVIMQHQQTGEPQAPPGA